MVTQIRKVLGLYSATPSEAPNTKDTRSFMKHSKGWKFGVILKIGVQVTYVMVGMIYKRLLRNGIWIVLIYEKATTSSFYLITLVHIICRTLLQNVRS